MLVVDGLPFEHLDWPVVDLLTVHWLLLVECDDCLVVHHVDRLVLHHVDQLVDRLLGNWLIVVELVKRQRDRYIFLNHRVFDPHMPTFLLWCGFGSFFPLPFGMSGIASDVTLGFAFKATLFSESTASSYLWLVPKFQRRIYTWPTLHKSCCMWTCHFHYEVLYVGYMGKIC